MSASDQAKVAIKAAKNVIRWGRFAAARFALSNGVPLEMWITALRFEDRRRIRNEFRGYLA